MAFPSSPIVKSISKKVLPHGLVEANKFSKLTLLLRLILCMNQGNPTIPHYEETLEVDTIQQLDFGVLDAVSAILVQDHEVIATTYTASRVSVMVESPGATPTSDIDIPVDAQPTPGLKVLYPLRVAAIANPRSQNPDLKEAASIHKIQLIPKGHDLWPMVKESPFYCALM